MNIIRRFTILFLLATLLGQTIAAFAPLGEAAEVCDSECCESAHQMNQMASLAVLDAGLCCIIEGQPDAEIPPLVTLSKPGSQPLQGLLTLAAPAPLALIPYTKIPSAPPRYLRDVSSRYLKTGALLI